VKEGERKKKETKEESRLLFYTCPQGIPSSSQLVWAICCPVILSQGSELYIADHLEKTNNSHKAT
jgi:hypothetical protein